MKAALYLQVLVAVLCNAGAQTLIKLTSTQPRGAASHAGLLFLQQHKLIPPALAVLLYLLSFYLTFQIYKEFPLSIISPVMAGCIFIAIQVAAFSIFGEHINLIKTMGIASIVLGVFLLTNDA